MHSKINTIGEALEKNTSVTRLDLSSKQQTTTSECYKLLTKWNEIGCDGTKAIAGVLKANTALTELNLMVIL